MATEKTTLLTVEDDAGVRRSIVAFFEDLEYEVFEAEDGLAGLEAFRREIPDIVLVDLRMPRLDGLDVVRTLHGEAPETPVIVVSGTGVLRDAIEAVRAGAWDYVTKPIVDMAALQHVVEVSLQRARLLRENREYRERLEQLVSQRTEELAEREARYRSLFENAGEGMVVADVATMRFKYANPSACRLLGYSEAELTELTVPDVHPPGAVEHVLAEFVAQTRGQKVLSSEIPFQRKDGSVQYADVRATPCVVEGTQCMLGMLSDITGRLAAEDATRRKQKQLDDLLSNVDAIVMEGDPFNIYYLGGQFEQILGYTREEWFGDPNGPLGFWTKHLHPEDKSSLAFCQQATERGEDHSFEYRLIGADGKPVWFHDRVTVETENGKPVKMRCVMMDITERKRAEEERRSLESQLRHTQKMEALGTLAGGIAHDFNNILAGIMGYADILLHQVKRSKPPRWENLEKILDGGTRAKQLVNRILAFSRQGENRMVRTQIRPIV